jgi:hypothetical protein
VVVGCIVPVATAALEGADILHDKATVLGDTVKGIACAAINLISKCYVTAVL